MEAIKTVILLTRVLKSLKGVEGIKQAPLSESVGWLLSGTFNVRNLFAPVKGNKHGGLKLQGVCTEISVIVLTVCEDLSSCPAAAPGEMALTDEEWSATISVAQHHLMSLPKDKCSIMFTQLKNQAGQALRVMTCSVTVSSYIVVAHPHATKLIL